MKIPKGIKYLVGLDEAGRGALAGPVAVGMFAWPVLAGELLEAVPDYPVGRDSKKLTPKMRDKWFSLILELATQTGAINQVSFVGQSYIDRAGIVPAVARGIEACLEKLPSDPTECLLLLDGGLKGPREFVHQVTIIKGDEKEPLISLASILAKVARDRKIIKLSQTYPGYGLENHKGYGTKEHYENIVKLGLSTLHRRSYLQKCPNCGINKDGPIV